MSKRKSSDTSSKRASAAAKGGAAKGSGDRSASAPADKRETRRIVAITVIGAASLFLVTQFAFLIQPAAAREIQAACNGLRPAATNPSLGPVPGQQAVDFTAQDHEGKMVKLSDYRGQVVFVNFWASWCNVCKAEKPSLDVMARELQDEYGDFQVLSLASDTEWGPIRESLPEGTAFDVLLDPPANEDENLGAIAKQFGLKAVPESFVVDRDGTLRYYFINKRDWDSDIAETCLRSLLEEG
ncbi:TlpA disulfide reductase family protein [Haliangium ochraceum]|uniref:Alkyl hydroperoxide reductase/ Thiol specific antioxidant/ Mal allergen n=1 Tax=Haliangium ochraceum (strain DSM 14365 / JCM 11303 / SMP-2) TaxID=502025 RepID=D0LG75_HALO1|nr:TlpA disulfide reductase family protein [Haliangium ochraceum]ACY18100.1 alkyl hydroperoxide reductase/ Thiol specific antioxidant/ Mal allergen [Haliangium ochraceum DSM 14365]